MLIFPLMGFSQVFENAKTAFAKAEKENLNVLLVFSGSDWCMGCIRFEKNILNNPDFWDYARKNLVLLRADFPQKRKLSGDLVIQNDSLAGMFNTEGIFPAHVLLNTEGRMVLPLKYEGENAIDFINKLEQINQVKVGHE